MKRALLILVLLLCAPQQVSAGSLTKAPNNLGLVGYWSFNEGTGLKAGDFSGYGTHGTLTNGPTWAGGRFGGGLNFDGVNDYVTTGTYVVSASTDPISYNIWFKRSADCSNYNVLIGHGRGSGAGGPFLLCGYPGRTNEISAYTVNTYIHSGVTTEANRWYMATLTFDGSTQRLYVNGVYTTSSSGVGNDVNSNAFTIGGVWGTAQNYFYRGAIDEARVYNRALGANEIARLYNTGGVSKIQSAQSEAGTGLVGHWKLDDRAGTRATDSSGRGNHGTLTGFNFTGATSNWISGRLGGGLNFDGVNDYIDFGTSNTLNVYQSATFSLWFRQLGDAAGSYQPFIQRFGAAVTGYQIFSYNSNDTICFYTSNIACSTYVIGDSNWHHLVVANDGTTTRFYVDGVARGSATQSGVNITTATVNTIGNYAGNYFNGIIDDVRIYNRSLTAEQIKTLYASGTVRPAIANANSASLTAGTNLASGLVGHWSFDGKYLSSTTARDTSGQGNDGTLTNGPTVAIGKMGQALSFDGGNDYIRLPPISIPSAITVSAWVHSANFNQTGMIVMKQPVNAQWGIFFNNDNLLYWRGGGITAITCAAPSNNTWHHVVAKQTGTTATLYIDGSQCATGSVDAIANGTTVSTNDILISTYNGSSYPFSGSIDDVRVYNRALSATEVKQLYYLGK